MPESGAYGALHQHRFGAFPDGHAPLKCELAEHADVAIVGVAFEPLALARTQGRECALVEVRAATGLSDTQARIHLERLAALEYLLTHRGQRGQSYEYELLHDQASTEGQAVGPHLSGLIDTRALQAEPQTASTNQSSRGLPGELAGPKRPQNGSKTGDARTAKTAASPHGIRRTVEIPDETLDERATPGVSERVIPARASYLQPLAA